jgi:hypothetical protein
MGMELIVNALATTEADGLDWEAGIQLVKAIDIETLLYTETGDNIAVDFEPDDEGEFGDDAKKAVRGYFLGSIRNLKDSWCDGWRDQTIIDFGDWVIWIGGGSSDPGDPPGPTFMAMGTLMEVPEALKAIGFDWPEAS